MPPDRSKIIVGAAAFGTNYGIKNSAAPDIAEVKEILSKASEFKVWGLDTARDYPESEKRIGLARPNDLRIFSKFSHGTNFADFNQLQAQVMDSLAKLEIQNLEGMSPHSFRDFLQSGSTAVRSFCDLRESGLIRSWGLTFYEPKEFFAALDIGRPDFIQVPLSFVDQRFAKSGILKKAKELRIEVHSRSIFLQGALLMRPEELPSNLSGLAPSIFELRRRAERLGLSVESYLLSQALTSEGISRVVVGVNAAQQLEQLMKSILDTTFPDDEGFVDAFLDDGLIDPRGWAN